MKLLVRWILSACAILLTTFLLKGIHVESFQTALLGALILAIINITIKPLIFILTLPLTILTLGLFTIIINASLLLLTAAILPGFEIDNFWWAILFSIVLAVVNYALEKLVE